MRYRLLSTGDKIEFHDNIPAEEVGLGTSERVYVSQVFDFNDNSVLNEDLVISQTMREKRPGLNDELIIELKNRLSKGEVKFSFRKLNDRLRRARGTVDLNTILKENPDFGEWDKEYQPLKLKNPYVIRYYDLDKKNWRSCDVSRLLIIIE